MSAVVPVAPIAERLRHATAAQHRRVEARFGVMDPALSRAAYVDWLERLHGWYVPYERAVAPWGERLAIDWPARCRSALLARDLQRLGVAASRVAALRECAELPALPDIESVFGAVYVFEGSTLGGRVVARHLARVLGLGPDDGAGFFQPYGDDPVPRWRVFQARLAAVAAGPGAQERIIAAAGATFDAFDRWLAQPR